MGVGGRRMTTPTKEKEIHFFAYIEDNELVVASIDCTRGPRCTIPLGDFIGNGLSSPRWTRWFLPQYHRDYNDAARVHDYLYSHHQITESAAKLFNYTCPRLFADVVFMELARPSTRALIIYIGMRLTLKKSWLKYAP